MDFLRFLNLGWVGSLIGIAGVASGFIIYFYTNKKISPCYQYKTTTIVDKEKKNYSGDIEILYQGKNVSGVNRTVIAIWNDGKKYLEKDHVLENHPLTLSFPDGEILNHKIKDRTSDSISLDIKQKEDKALTIDFNLLDHKEGFAMEILHTSTEREPSISCIIKGVKSGFKNKGSISQVADTEVTLWPEKTLTTKAFIYLSLGFGCISTLLGFFYIHVDSMLLSGKEDIFTVIHSYTDSAIINGRIEKVVGVLGLSMGIFYIIGSAFLLAVLRKRAPKKLDLS